MWIQCSKKTTWRLRLNEFIVYSMIAKEVQREYLTPESTNFRHVHTEQLNHVVMLTCRRSYWITNKLIFSPSIYKFLLEALVFFLNFVNIWIRNTCSKKPVENERFFSAVNRLKYFSLRHKRILLLCLILIETSNLHIENYMIYLNIHVKEDKWYDDKNNCKVRSLEIKLKWIFHLLYFSLVSHWYL